MMIIKMIIGIAAYLLLAPAAGGLLSGLDRKLSARMQGRKGSSVKQPFYDVMKLMAKEQQTSSKIGDFFVIMFTVFTVASGVVFFGGGDMLLTVFLFSFVWQWTDSYYSSMLAPNLPTLNMQLFGMTEQLIANHGNIASSLLESPQFLLLILPLIILYLFTQRYFVEGIERSGIVG